MMTQSLLRNLFSECFQTFLYINQACNTFVKLTIQVGAVVRAYTRCECDIRYQDEHLCSFSWVVPPPQRTCIYNLRYEFKSWLKFNLRPKMDLLLNLLRMGNNQKLEGSSSNSAPFVRVITIGMFST